MPIRPLILVVLLGLCVLVLLGCTTTAPSSLVSPGDAGRGNTIFLQAEIKTTQGCVTCHSLEAGVVVVGPSLAGVATRAETIIYSVEYKGTAKTIPDYLRQSITNPYEFIADRISHRAMPEWDGILEPQQVEDLVMFLTTLK